MGIALAGLVFRNTSPRADIRWLLERLTGEIAVPLEHPRSDQFDIRDHPDVMVQFFGDSCVVCNHDVTWDLIENTATDASGTHAALGSPDLFMAFCCYESGDSYGYALFEHGRRTRTRLQTSDAPLIEFGTPTDIEQSWLSAPFRIEKGPDHAFDPEDQERIFRLHRGNKTLDVPEHFLTAQMLTELLQTRFGACPWETDTEPEIRLFRMKPGQQPRQS